MPDAEARFGAWKAKHTVPISMSEEQTERIAFGAYEDGVVREREACARVCDSVAAEEVVRVMRRKDLIAQPTGYEIGAQFCAEAIRARGKGD